MGTAGNGNSEVLSLSRRSLLKISGIGTLPLFMTPGSVAATSDRAAPDSPNSIALFLCGDVMTARGIDQILPNAGDPRICETYSQSAGDYVTLAERVNGPIPRPVDFAYIWGEALDILERAAPDLRIVNLETSITRSESCTDKGISYRMSPANMACLTAARIDCCLLANNHVLDWGPAGLIETLETLEKAEIATVGAGRDEMEAATPAIMEVPGKGRVIVFAFGSVTSGIPRHWAAGPERPGVNLLQNLGPGEVERIARQVHAVKRPGADGAL